MSTLSESLVAHARKLPEGELLTARNLAQFGTRKRVGGALSRLTREGKLLRATRGVYVRPVEGKFGKRPPSAAKVAEAIATSRGEVVAMHGAMSANILGLTTQVPTRSVMLTSGRDRTINVGSQPVEMRHAPDWQLVLAKRPAGEVVRALAWLAPERVGPAVEKLRTSLPKGELAEVSSIVGSLPAWLAERVRAFA